jgi:hypothetical protein
MPRDSPDDNQRIGPRTRSRSGIYAFLTLSIALLLAVTGLGGASPAGAHAASATSSPAQAPKPPPTIWGACPLGDRPAAELKLVRRFDRAQGIAAGVVPMPAGSSDLLCGTANYGFYHIVARHHVEWTQKSVKTNETWREVADYAIAEVLRSPTSVTFRPRNNTFCYSREISLIDKVRGITVDVMHPNVVVRAQDGAVITAIPTRKSC